MWQLFVDSMANEPEEFERANEMFVKRDEYAMQGRATWYEKVD